MATRRDAKTPPSTEPATPAPPPYYIAEQPLFIGGNQFARAHNVGDRVPAEHVDRYGWRAGVRTPDGYETPAPPQPSNEPETATGGLAASSKEGV